MSTGLGLALLEAALDGADPVVVAARWDLAGLRSRPDGVPAVLRGLVVASRRSGVREEDLRSRLAALDPEQIRDELRDVVRRHVASVLAHPDPSTVDVDTTFNALGFQSLSAVELRNRLNGDTGLRLPATLAFDHPTVSAVADYLTEALAPAPPQPEETLERALDQLRHELSRHDEDTRARVVGLLHSGLSDPESGVAEHDIGAASDDEIFAFIDSQL
jgi:acyl carrier protein